LHSQALGSGLNPRGALDFSPLYFFAKEKWNCKEAGLPITKFDFNKPLLVN